MAIESEAGVTTNADFQPGRARVRLDDFRRRASRVGWDQVPRFEDGSVLGSDQWALCIARHDGRVITAEGTCCRMTAARPETLAAPGAVAWRQEAPAELTGMPPGMERGGARSLVRGHRRYPETAGREPFTAAAELIRRWSGPAVRFRP